MYFSKIPLAPHSVFWGLPRKIKCIPGSIVVVILPFKCDSMWLLCIGEKTILHNSPLKIYFYGFLGSFHCHILENNFNLKDDKRLLISLGVGLFCSEIICLPSLVSLWMLSSMVRMILDCCHRCQRRWPTLLRDHLIAIILPREWQSTQWALNSIFIIFFLLCSSQNFLCIQIFWNHLRYNL